MTIRYLLAVTTCIAFCLALTPGLTPFHPHFPSQSIALVMLYTMVIALVSHAILTIPRTPYRLRIAIGTPITTIFCATLILTRYDDWNFIMQHRKWDVLVCCSLCSAAVFYVVEGWFWMYRQALFDPDTNSGG